MWRTPASSASSLLQPLAATTSRFSPSTFLQRSFGSFRTAARVQAAVSCSHTSLSTSQLSLPQQRLETSQLATTVQPSSSFLFSSSPNIHLVKILSRQLQPSLELGFLCLLFAVSMAIAAVFTVAVVSIPTMMSLRRLGISLEELQIVIAREISGTGFSLRLFEMEVNEITNILKSVRQKISTIKGDKSRRKPGVSEGEDAAAPS